jgi:flagellar biosynthesis protein FlhG
MEDNPRARRYAVVSGKGGVGKSVITANLAAAFAASGRRTLVLDADLSLANLDVILGIDARGSIQDVLTGRLTLDDALVRTRSGFDLLPAGSGLFESTQLTEDLAKALEELLAVLESRYDAILFDAGAGIGEVVLFFARIADEVVLVVTPEPTSLTDAYATVKVLSLRFGCRNFRVIVNQADPASPEDDGARITSHLQRVASRFLTAGGMTVRLHFSGSLPADPSVSRAISRQQLLLESDPRSPAASLFPRLAEALFTAPASAR